MFWVLTFLAREKHFQESNKNQNQALALPRKRVLKYHSVATATLSFCNVCLYNVYMYYVTTQYYS